MCARRRALICGSPPPRTLTGQGSEVNDLVETYQEQVEERAVTLARACDRDVLQRWLEELKCNGVYTDTDRMFCDVFARAIQILEDN